MDRARTMDGATANDTTPRGSLAAFYALALAISWAVWMPWVLSVQGVLRVPSARYLHLLGSLGPAIAALVILIGAEGRDAVRRFARRTFTARAATQAAIWAVAAPTLVFLATVLVMGLTSRWVIRWNVVGVAREYPALAPPVYALASLFFYGFGEEIGWRGFLYPRLRQRHGLLAASLLVVPFWAFWHLPLFFATDSYRAMGVGGAAGWLISLVSGSLLTAWLTDRARGSILPAAVLHAVLDIYFLAEVGAPTQAVLGAAVTVAGIAIAVVSAVKARRS
jgi:membrane protease YdiL (CAAX protease family)